jgi:hypothetical protein
MAPQPAIVAAALASGISVPVKAYKSAVALLAARLITDGYGIVAVKPEAVGPLLDARDALFDALAGSTTAAGASSPAVRRLPTHDLLELAPGNEVQPGCNVAQWSAGVQVGTCSSRDARRQRRDIIRPPAAMAVLPGAAAAFTGSALPVYCCSI